MAQKKRPLQALAWMILVIFAGFWGLNLAFPRLPSPDEPLLLYSNQNRDDLRDLMIQAIDRAGESIEIAVYALSDIDVIRRINHKAEEGLKVQIIVDADASSDVKRKLHPNTHIIYRSAIGLMHLKILIVDQEQVFMGSANFTTESLRAHGNIVVGFWNAQLAKDLHTAILKKPKRRMSYGGTQLHCLPDDDRALRELITLINEAKERVCVAMYTWTHPALTAAMQRAAERGVKVEVIMDAGSSTGTSRTAFSQLSEVGLAPRIQSHWGLLHYKMAWIDGETLVLGSANWTRSAFTRNSDALIVLRELPDRQAKTAEKIWKAIRRESRSAQNS